MLDDIVAVFNWVVEEYQESNVILVGHSMGGSLAVKAVQHILSRESLAHLHPRLQGIVIIDVVEGTAMEALPFMEAIINSRPKSFASV